MLELPSVIISKVSTLSDKCLRIQLDTPELPANTMSQIFLAYMSGVKGVRIKEINLPEAKSPAARLRSCIYVLYEKLGSPGGDFEAYYSKYMNMLCEKVKENIP